jgi:hypothetical protein
MSQKSRKSICGFFVIFYQRSFSRVRWQLISTEKENAKAKATACQMDSILK